MHFVYCDEYYITESSISISGNVDGEANVLVQAIMSIKAIIKENPANHEKVSLL